MHWLSYSLSAAFLESFKDVLGKQSLKHCDEYLVSFCLRFFGLFVVLPLLAFAPIPHLGPHFWGALLTGGVLNVAATLLYIKAIRHSDLSLTVPYVMLSPLFLLITSPFMVGEFPTLPGLAGVLLVVSGSCALAFDGKNGLKPFKMFWKEKGPKKMVLVAFIWSITANVDKIGIQASSPLFWAAAINLAIVLFMTPLLLWKSPQWKTHLRKNTATLVPIGLVSGVVLLLHQMAISMALVAYVVSVKRLSALFTVLWGRLFFGEKNLRQRLTGTLLMLAGVWLIALG